MTRTFKTPEELMIALIQGEKWTTSHITGVCVFDKDKVPDFNPFRCKTDKTDFAISAGLYTHCDGKTLWTKVEEKTELDLMKEKYATGGYILLSLSCVSKKRYSLVNTPPFWDLEAKYYKLIHKKHKDILDAYLADNDVEIEILGNDFYAEWADLYDVYTGNFIDSYNEDFEYRLKSKKKTVSLAMFTCQTNVNTWICPEIWESLDSFKEDNKYGHNHHEIPNTRYEIEIDDE